MPPDLSQMPQVEVGIAQARATRWAPPLRLNDLRELLCGVRLSKFRSKVCVHSTLPIRAEPCVKTVLLVESNVWQFVIRIDPFAIYSLTTNGCASFPFLSSAVRLLESSANKKRLDPLRLEPLLVFLSIQDFTRNERI